MGPDPTRRSLGRIPRRVRRSLEGIPARARRAPGLGLAIAVAERASRDAVGMLAAALTYYLFLSLFPLLLLGLSVLGFVLSDPAEQARWAERLAGAVPGLEPLLGRNLRALARGRAEAGAVGLAGLLWTSLGTAEAAREVLARVFRRRPTGNLLLQKLRSAVSLGLVGLVALASTAATALLSGGAAGPLRPLGYAATFALDTALFLAVYRYLTPGPGPPYRDLLPAALAMGAGWNALKVAGTWYALRVVARASAVYGAFAAALGILAVLHVATPVFVYGAEVAAELMERRGRLAAEG
ncbi:MAG TPA: YhjD/YihY/BrkB family envelope integrity protein [Actinomycetota bacterium]|nr:YhjD/YihY/BrkB family envelope integrity protein [Actinomycetota bacterium]